MSMNALQINFVAPPRRASWLGWGLATLGLVGALVVAQHYSTAQDALDDALADQTRLQQRKTPPGASHKPQHATAGGRDERQSATQVAAQMSEQLQLPWDALLKELERLSLPDVALVQLDLQGHGRKLRLQGEAHDMDAVVKYAQALRQSPLLAGVVLSGSEERTIGAATVLRFTLEATWNRAQ